jgi:hypothetical protein
MTTQELKIEIQNVLNEIPENVLEDILIYLKDIKNLSESDINLSYNLSKIIREDKELLEKLAG